MARNLTICMTTLIASVLLTQVTAAFGQESGSQERGRPKYFALSDPQSDEPSGGGQMDSSSMESETTTSTAGDPTEDIQSFNTYSSLEDGQPGQRGELQFNFFNGWETQSGESDPWIMNMEIEYSPDVNGSWFWQNSKFGIDIPLELANGGVDGNGDIELVWKQRLIKEDYPSGTWPTVTMENELRLPTGDNSSGVDWTFQMVAAKELGPGTAIANAFFTSANGHNNIESASWWDQPFYCDRDDDSLRHFQWGFRFGYKWRLSDTFAVIADYVHQSSELEGDPNQNIGEVSAEWRVDDKLTIGPGIMFGLDGQDETPNFGAGVLVHYSIQ